MRTSFVSVACLVSTLPLVAFAQDDDFEEGTPPPEQQAPQVQPNTPMPSLQPPPPAYVPRAQGMPQPLEAPPTSGQWVFTAQYGWVWMPYGQAYTYVPEDDGAASMFVYTTGWGWRWLSAPWVFGWGTRPYWGAWGCHHFAWYSRPWFRARGHGGYSGIGRGRPTYGRGSFGAGRPSTHVGGHFGGGHFGGGHAGGGSHGFGGGGHGGGVHSSGGHAGGGHRR